MAIVKMNLLPFPSSDSTRILPPIISTIAFEMANAMVEKFGGDSLVEMKRNYDGYRAALGSRWEALQGAGALSEEGP